MKLGVIGAGPAGLVAIKHAVSFGCDVVAFEHSDRIGGTWNYTDVTDTDKYGIEVHSSMYQGLLSNTPKEIMSYPGFPFELDEDKSFVTSEEVLKYFHVFAKTFDLLKHIKFEHHVLRVRPLLNGKWEFIVKNLPIDKCESIEFDAVLVCNGFSVPYLRKFPGQDLFRGRQIHSHFYRTSKSFEHEKVLIIGGGASGMDLFRDISSVAKRVVWSHHQEESFGKRVSITFPPTAAVKPDVIRLTETGAEFTDKSFEEFSSIIYATGFDYKFPFLSIDCGLSCNEKLVSPLYKHCINVNNPTMGIIGLPYFAVAMPLFDLQVRFCLTFITGRKQLPTREEMLEDTEKDMAERRTRLKKHRLHFLGLEKHEEYYNDLAQTAEIEGLKPVIGKIFNKTFGNLFDNYDNFRSYKFKIIDEENFEMW